MKKYILFLLLIILSSCKDDITNAEINKQRSEITFKFVKADQKNNVIMPLEVANEWVYKITNYDAQGVIISTEYKTIKIDGVEEFNGDKWYHSDNKTILWVNTDLGLMTKNVDCACEKEFRAKYPAVVGDEYLSWIADTNMKSIMWNSNGTDNQIVNIYAEFYKQVNTNISITTDAGSFICYEYRDKTVINSESENVQMAQYSVDYYSENIGLIKTICYITEKDGYSFKGKIKQTVELINYKLN